jgi:hypothetical protein
MKTLIRRFAAFSLIGALAGCGGGSGTAAAPKGMTQVSVTLKLDAGTKASSAQRAGKAGSRLPRYVSPATNGLEITVYPTGTTPPSSPTVFADVSATSSNCNATPNPDGSRTCTVTLPAPAGNDDFLVTATDQTPQSSSAPGKSLSTGTVHNVTVTAGQSTVVNVTLDGIVAAISPQPPVLSTAADGKTHTFALGVNLQDADGFFIVATTPLSNPLTAAVTGDASGTITVNAPQSGSDPSAYSITYNGGALTDGTITFSATGATSGTANVAPIVGSPTSLTLTHGTGTATLATSQALYAGALYASSTNPATCVTVTNPTQTPGPPGTTYTFSISAAVATGPTACAILVSGLDNAVLSIPVTVN